MSVPFDLTLSAAEARLIREPGDRGVLDGLLARVVNRAYKEGAEHVTAAWPGVLRGVVEGLAEQGNPRAVAALMFESRLAEQAPTPEKGPAEPQRVVAELSWPVEALRVEVIGVPPAEPKTMNIKRGLDGKIVSATSSGG